MKKIRFSVLTVLILVLLLSPVLSGCSLVTAVDETTGEEETEPAVETTVKETTAKETTAVQTTATTAEPEPDPVILGTHLKTVPDESYVATPYATQSDKYTTKIIQKLNSTSGATMVNMPSRAGVEYARKLPVAVNLNYAANRSELVKIVNWRAFYRESGFSVTLGYSATDVEEELNYLWRHSDLLASQCALYGTLSNGVITVNLKFYEEKYLAVPRYTTPAVYLGAETPAPKWTETLPGLDLEHGVSVWDSEQACYALANGYKISPIPNSPAASLVETAKTILAGMVDDSMDEWQIAYRVFVWLMNHAAYDQAEHWAGKIDQADRAKESEALSARVIGFKAEGPLLYGVGACFGFAKASVLLLGLEGINVRRVVAFFTRLPAGRCCIIANSQSIAIHSYLYLRIGGYDYIFDPTYVGENKQTVSGADISVFRDFAIGMSFTEHRTVFGSYYPEPDFYAETAEYKPASFNYLTSLTFDGKHDLLLTSLSEAQFYYDYLLETVFSKPAEYRTVTLIYSTWSWTNSEIQQLEDLLEDFLEATGVDWVKTSAETINRQGVKNGKMIKIAFGKKK